MHHIDRDKAILAICTAHSENPAVQAIKALLNMPTVQPVIPTAPVPAPKQAPSYVVPTPPRFSHPAHLLRGSGITTAQALRTLADAIDCRHSTFKFRDHHGAYNSNVEQRRAAQRIVDVLGLQGMEFTNDSVTCTWPGANNGYR